MTRDDDNERDNVSLLDSIFDQFGINFRTQGREKALTQAFYNSMSVILIGICGAAVICVFIILQPFIWPLWWAVFVGSALHPFKFKLSTCFKKWLNYLEKSNKPLTLEVISLPCCVILSLSTFVGNIVISKIGLCILGIFGSSISLFWLYEYTPETIINSSWLCFKWTQLVLCFFLDTFENSWVVTLLLCTYLGGVFTLWNGHKTTLLYVASCVAWFGCACYIAGYFNYLRLPVMLFFLTVTIFGTWSETSSKGENKEAKPDPNLNSKEADSLSDKIDKILKDEFLSDKVKNKEDVFIQESPIKSEKHESNKDSPVDDSNVFEETCDDEEDVGYASPDISKWLHSPHTSDLYIYLVALCCVVFIVFTNLWLLYIIAFLLLIYIIKCFFLGFGLWLLVQEFWDRLDRLESWYTARRDILIPMPVSAFFTTMGIIKCYILRGLQDFCDAAASVTVILGLLGLVIIVSVFLCIQMYTECFYMVKVSGQVINQTVVHNPELRQLLPKGWEDQLDSVLNNAYTHGREWLRKMLYALMRNDVPQDKAEETVQTGLELFDRVYQVYVSAILEQQNMGPKVTSSAVFESWGQFVDGIKKTFALMNFNNIQSLLMENMAVLSSSFDSLWSIVKGNVSLLFYTVTTFFSVIIGHGAALLGFFINMIVFLTALFYLLNSSRELYKPVEILTNMIPQYGNTLAVAMETAAKEVLVASFKLTIFYGLWTWFIHSLFVGNIVYIPSVLAAILAVVPVLGTYWACLPGVLDLWLVQGKGFHAILLAIFQFLPTTIVDTAIYTDIHGGHPYLTGLAVAGGVLYLGPEGAIIGPLALCGLLVVINLSSGLLKESAPSPPNMSPESSTKN